MKITKLTIMLIILNGFFLSASAQWNPNTVTNNPVSSTTQTQYNAVVAYDGSGGVIIGWLDWRDGFSRLYAQRYNSAGVPQWTTNGVLLTPENGIYIHETTRLKIIADGSGGAVFSFCARVPGISVMVYSQKVNSSGQIQWALPVAATIDNPSSDYDEQFDIASDNNGGVIIAFRRWSNPAILWEVITQRINSSGTRMWGNYGVKVVQSPVTGVEEPIICQDNNNGAIIAWKDGRSGQIYSQRVNSNGVTQWTANGFAVFPGVINSRYNTKIISDGVGGAIITAEDNRNTGSMVYDIYAQRVIDNFRLWGDGKIICNNTANQRFPSMISDKMGGAYIAWIDYRNPVQEIYLQRVDPNGNSLFQSNGMPTALTRSYSISLSNYDANTMIVTSAFGIGDSSFISAQKFSYLGTFLWANSNMQVCNNARSKIISNNASITDNDGNLIVVWSDYVQNKVFAQKTTGLTNTDPIEITAESFSLSQNYPNPFNPVTKIVFEIPSNVNSKMSKVNLSIYDISGKLVETLINSSIESGTYEVQFNASSLASGTYFYKLTAGGFVQTKKMQLIK